MDTDDKKDLNRDPLAPRLTLMRGESRGVMPPHQAPKLELIVNPEWKLYQALMANDPRRVEEALARGADPNARDPDGRHTALRGGVVAKRPGHCRGAARLGRQPPGA